MTAILNNESLTGVSVNSIHLKNGAVMVQAISVTKKAYVERTPADFVKGNAIDFIELVSGSTFQASDVKGDFVLNTLATARNTENVTLSLPTTGTPTPGLAAFSSVVTAMLNSANDGDYADPSVDLPAFDLVGSFVYSPTGAVFNVTDVTTL